MKTELSFGRAFSFWIKGAAILLVAFSISASAQITATGQRPVTEIQGIKALFDENYYWLTKQGADKLIADAKKGGFNTIIPCIWHGRGASWNSALAAVDSKLPREQIIKNDPLGYLINTAHTNGLKVFPWITVFKRELDFLPEYKDPSTDHFFNIHNDQYINFISNIALEIVTRYDTDGINLDYIRSTGQCLSASCIRAYNQKTGRDLKTDITISLVSPAAKASLLNWQIDAVTAGVKAISSKVRAAKPTQIISVDTIVNDDTWRSYGADGINWLNSGLIDIAFQMDYHKSLLKNVIHGAQTQLREPERLFILISNVDLPPDAIQPRAGAHVGALLDQVSQLAPNHRSYGFYEYKFLTDEHYPYLIKFNLSPPAAPSGVNSSVDH